MWMQLLLQGVTDVSHFFVKDCKMLCFLYTISRAELNVSEVSRRSQWLDADFGRSPNNRCTLHQ